jgi:MSHA biogenesis protein MshM
MYLQHFGLKEFPFSITPDTEYFFSSEAAQRALNTLLVAAEAGEGFIKITGEVGTGKTLLCRQLLASVGPQFQTAYLPNPMLDPAGLFLALAEELGIDVDAMSPTTASQTLQGPHLHALLKALNARLLELARAGKRTLFCLDEVQAMPIETLEALRLLTNLETEKRKLMQVVIFGQPELDRKLAHPAVRQIKQRISFDYRLTPLTGPEMARYLDHRTAVAGYPGTGLFTAPARRLLRLRTRGVPRLVNIVAHKALMCAYGRGKARVGVAEMREAINDTASLAPLMRLQLLGTLVVGCLGLIVIGLARIV